MVHNEYYSKVLNMPLPYNHGMRKAVVGLMQYLLIADNLAEKTEFDLMFLRSKVHWCVSREDFINGVMFLTRSNIAVLVPQYKVWDDAVQSHVPVLPDDVWTAVRDRTYFNPVTGEKLSAEEFSNQIQLSFVPSKGFLKSVRMTWDIT